MKVVFFEDVEGTADVGDVKVVKNGFARNFLLPQGLAGPTTPPNLQRANSLAEKEARRQAKLDGEAVVHQERLEGYAVTFEARVGETGRLYGSVTNRDIAQKVEESSGIEIDPRAVLLSEPIRDLGTRSATIKFTRNVSVDIIVVVEPDEDSKEIVEQLMVEQAEEAAREAAEEAAIAEAALAEAEAEAALATEAVAPDEVAEATAEAANESTEEVSEATAADATAGTDEDDASDDDAE